MSSYVNDFAYSKWTQDGPEFVKPSTHAPKISRFSQSWEFPVNLLKTKGQQDTCLQKVSSLEVHRRPTESCTHHAELLHRTCCRSLWQTTPFSAAAASARACMWSGWLYKSLKVYGDTAQDRSVREQVLKCNSLSAAENDPLKWMSFFVLVKKYKCFIKVRQGLQQ